MSRSFAPLSPPTAELSDFRVASPFFIAPVACSSAPETADVTAAQTFGAGTLSETFMAALTADAALLAAYDAAFAA